MKRKRFSVEQIVATLKQIELGMKVIAYPYGGYWIDVGTVDAYWEAHMDLLTNRDGDLLNSCHDPRSDQRPI